MKLKKISDVLTEKNETTRQKFDIIKEIQRLTNNKYAADELARKDVRNLEFGLNKIKKAIEVAEATEGAKIKWPNLGWTYAMNSPLQNARLSSSLSNLPENYKGKSSVVGHSEEYMDREDYSDIYEKVYNYVGDKEMNDAKTKTWTIMWGYTDEDGEPYTGTSVTYAKTKEEAIEKVKKAHPEIKFTQRVIEGNLGGEWADFVGDSEINEDDEEGTWLECEWCGEEYPPEELKTEKTIGKICPHCIEAIKSHGEPVELIEDDGEKIEVKFDYPGIKKVDYDTKIDEDGNLILNATIDIRNQKVVDNVSVTTEFDDDGEVYDEEIDEDDLPAELSSLEYLEDDIVPVIDGYDLYDSEIIVEDELRLYEIKEITDKIKADQHRWSEVATLDVVLEGTVQINAKYVPETKTNDSADQLNTYVVGYVDKISDRATYIEVKAKDKKEAEYKVSHDKYLDVYRIFSIEKI